MAIDLSAMTADTAPQGWKIAAELFGTAIEKRTMDLLTPRVLGLGKSTQTGAEKWAGVVDLTVAVASDPMAKKRAGLTRLEFRDTGQAIHTGVVQVNSGIVTEAAVAQRGLRFLITLNKASDLTAGTGKVLETICHEYGGHACPFGDYLGFLDHDAPEPRQAERNLDRAMSAELMGGMQHLSMQKGTALYFNGLIAAVRSMLQQESQGIQAILHDLDAALTADMNNLKGPTAQLSTLLLATSDTSDT